MTSLWSSLPAAATLLLVLAGCDPSVDPFQENDLHYSIFGYLDASADTQLVRVEPLRDGLLTRAPAALNADVTLTNLATDHTISLRDSLFQYSDQTSFHNFYTTAAIEPTGTYRLTVQGPDDAASRVQTSVPDSFPAPTVVTGIPDCFPDCGPSGLNCSFPSRRSAFAVVHLEGIERLVAVRAVFHMEQPRGVWTFGHLADTVHTERGVVEAWIDYGDDWCSISFEEKRVSKVEVMVARGGPDWPDFMEIDQEAKMLPGTASNVEGGVGFLGGIVTDTVVVYPYSEL